MTEHIELTGGMAYSILKELHHYAKAAIILKTDEEAADLAENVLCLSKILSLPIPEILFIPENNVQERIKNLKTIYRSKNYFATMSEYTSAKKTFSFSSLENAVLGVSIGSVIPRVKFESCFIQNGYENTDLVTDTGQFSFRGEVLDIWSPVYDMPLRIFFDFNTIKKIKIFNPFSQRTLENIETAEIIPVKETEETEIMKILIESAHLFEQFEFQSFLPVPKFYGNIDFFKQTFSEWDRENLDIFIISNNPAEKEHLTEILGKEFAKYIYSGTLSSGFIHSEEGIVFVTANEIFSRYRLKNRTPKFKTGISIESPGDIGDGEFVVHEKYGIGIYKGLKKISNDGITAEYLSLLYDKGDYLYVPVNDFHLIQKYFSVTNRRPALNSLDGTLWKKTRLKATENAKKIAKELLDLYSARHKISRPSFTTDSHYVTEFEKEFIYEETEDQQNAVQDLKNDMSGIYPMDRCIFGDVGFGKTEIAMRAAFISVLSGKQVCILAPTTVLVQQHEMTFKERFADWPVKIESLTRFKSKGAQKKIISGMKKGDIDIVIGTHRILSKDIFFRDLGLIIIDEEHRFGVAAKEKMKMIKKNVDCLYLTATPIPRTLSMSLAGIKNVSSISTPPAGRQQIDTMLQPHDNNLIKNAIIYEISRGGQVFYIHNRIETLLTRVNALRDAMPLIKFDFLHGQMEPKTIENKMLDFLNGKFDCLISTTIIEAGLDIPNVNTIVVENADRFGLGQLYQLRGRVGRSKIKAYCYLFYSDSNLTEEGKKRLDAIREFSKLGSGFQLALRDLQIRGAGELLGKKQHGYIDSVGFDMYVKLLERYAKNGGTYTEISEITPEIDILAEAVIPDDYISSEILRIQFYKKIAAADCGDKIKEELNDRFGKPPESVINLIEINLVRRLAKKLGIIKISHKEDGFIIEFADDTVLSPNKLLSILKYEKFQFLSEHSLKICICEKNTILKNIIFIKNLLKSLL
ncbi:MAG: Transcription-repair-coupling factor [Elusimicrobia bacterium ADurb.Bin231]|nr:MAG: Transcription-repair-coupling factor [Elusimicrobia bacterium ADurb.Bin231]